MSSTQNLTPEQANAKALTMVANLSDGALCSAWMFTEGEAITPEIGMTRGWILDELQKRLGDDLFDEWLCTFDENGDGLNPAEFFETNAAA